MQIVRFPFDSLKEKPAIGEAKPHPPIALPALEPLSETESLSAPPPEGEAPAPNFIEMPEVIRLTEEETVNRENAARAAGTEEGYARGLAEGKGERLELDTKLADTLETLKITMATSEGVFTESLDAVKSQLIQLAGDIALKLAGRALGEKPEAAVTEMLEQMIPHIIQQPAIHIFVHPSLADSLQEKIISLSSFASIAGRCSVHPAAELEPGDCRVEWKNGSATLDKTALTERLQRILEDYS